MAQINTTGDQNAYNAGVTNFTSGMNDLVSGQNDQVDATNATYAPQIKGLQDQLSGFNDQISNIKNTLNNLPANVTARGNGMGSDAQLSRQVTAESTPLQANLANLGLAEAPVSNALTTTQSNQQQALSALNDKFARETTGYTTTAQATLNALLDKLTNDRTLNAADMQQTYDLAKLQAQYQQTLATSQASTAQSNALMSLLGGGSGSSDTSTPASTAPNVGTLTRVPGTDNVTAGGWSGTREGAAAIISGTNDTNSQAYQQAYNQILQEFPSTVKPAPKPANTWNGIPIGNGGIF